MHESLPFRNFAMQTLRGTILLAILGTTAALAVPTTARTAEPDGNWLFTLVFPNPGMGEFKLAIRLTLKADGETLTGRIGSASGVGIVDILDGKFKDGQVAFRVVDPSGVGSRYKGKL